MVFSVVRLVNELFSFTLCWLSFQDICYAAPCVGVQYLSRICIMSAHAVLYAITIVSKPPSFNIGFV
jgi:hypothetical protein